MVYSHSKKILDNIERSFNISLKEMKRIIKDFRLEMERGLSGKKSSLKMIPTYVDIPTGSEKGKFIALDLGGTNFRILELELKGRGVTTAPKVMRFTLDKRYTEAKSSAFFGFLAECVKMFLEKFKIGRDERIKLGFTFSFPVKQDAIDSGKLLIWTKGFNIKGVVGKDVVNLFNEALSSKGLNNITVSALANDTVGTMVARSYNDRSCDVGVIIGTGTNACYREDMRSIPKWTGPSTPTGHMIINTEWGNFNKLKLTPYDKRLDRASDKPGEQVLEKMVSGMYLGKLSTMAFQDLIKPKKLKRHFTTEDMSIAESDKTVNLSKINTVLKRAGISNATSEERHALKKICNIISIRASRISAAAIASIVIKIDPSLSRRHTVAIDGSVYERHPVFAKNMNTALRKIFQKKALRITLALAKDGSGKGAAIIAAIAKKDNLY